MINNNFNDFKLEYERETKSCGKSILNTRIWDDCVRIDARQYEDHIYLYWITSYPTFHAGNGARCMTWLCSLADKYELPIKLQPTPMSDTLSEDKLVEFYEKFGFYQEYPGATLMIRNNR